MKTLNAVLAALLFGLFVVSGCASVTPAVSEREGRIAPAVTEQEEELTSDQKKAEEDYRRRLELWDFMGDGE